MSDDDVDAAFQADLDRLRAAIGQGALGEASSRRGLGDQMMFDALSRTLEANDRPLWRTDPSAVMWGSPATPGWGWDPDDDE